MPFPSGLVKTYSISDNHPTGSQDEHNFLAMQAILPRKASFHSAEQESPAQQATA